MNLQALFDGILAAVALWVAVRSAHHWPALRLACLILGTAAVLGTLRFSGVLPLPAMHQFVSLLGAGVGLPLLAISVALPTSAVAQQRRYAWIFAVITAVMCILVAMVAQVKLWPSVCALTAALFMLVTALRRRDGLALAAGASILAALIAFATKLTALTLVPGDFLHMGLTVGLLLVGRWVRYR
mgnify:FL=1